jgi:hypothetical protein
MSTPNAAFGLHATLEVDDHETVLHGMLPHLVGHAHGCALSPPSRLK